MGMNDKHDYDPTKWVDNSEPDIDAEHLNKIEAALQECGISIDELAAAVGQRIMQSQIVNNLLATKAGNVLDAMQGKALDDKIAEANKNISNNADAVSKLNGDKVSQNDLNNRVSSRLSLYWSNDPVGLVIHVDSYKKLISVNNMQNL